MKRKLTLICGLVLMLLCFAASSALPLNRAQAVQYTRDASLHGGAYPGVYTVKAVPGDQKATLGIPSIARQNLNAPTTESPAIIMGGAVPYEKRVGPIEFDKVSGGALYPPYSYFRYEVLEEKGPDGSVHQKMSGYDGSYVIIRVDVSELIKDAPAGSWLHVKQEGNKALMVALVNEPLNNGRATFQDASGSKAGAYSIDEAEKSLKDQDGDDRSKPYIDLVLMSSGTLVAGADTGSTDPTVISADFTLKFYVDQVGDYDPALVYDPSAPSPAAGQPTMSQRMMAKYYDESKAPSGTVVTSYTVKGSDLELEVVHPGASGGKDEFWSLREAMAWPRYNDTPIKMICEVPVLQGLTVDGTGGNYRHVIFDVNSFDIQLANHQETNAAALTVKNAKLTIKDGFNTTGAELAVGNNARMSIQEGGTLVIDETCQLEVEYDAASTTPGSGSTAPDLTYGVITIENGGEIVNRGVITIEGTEGKPIDPAAPSIRDMQAAELHIHEGGKLTNEGSLLAYGRLYNLGTIVNDGRYDDTIVSGDPDKGRYAYHRGIQIAWKDDVTQQGVIMGHLFNGNGEGAAASLVNNGDIVLAPGYLENFATLTNKGNIYLGAVDGAVIPINPTVWDPLVRVERIGFERPAAVFFVNNAGGRLDNQKNIEAVYVEIPDNGQTGKLTPTVDENLIYDISLYNLGAMSNSGNIGLNGVYTFGEMQNSGKIAGRVVLEANMQSAGRLTDRAGLSEIYNGARTEEGGATLWTHVGCDGLTVTPTVQTGVGGETVSWTLLATTAQEGAEGVRYLVQLYQGNGDSPLKTYMITANAETQVQSPPLPHFNGNAVYRFFLLDGLDSVSAEASVKDSSTAVTPPAVNGGLVYNGQPQALVTSGGAADGRTMLYRLGEGGEWSEVVPTATNAGAYKVYYKLAEVIGDPAAESVEAAIAPRPVQISGNDVASKVGEALAEPGFTVSGLVEGEALNGVQATTDANKDVAGTYAVDVTVTGENPNYAVTLQKGQYIVTEEAFNFSAKDKYGVFSDELTYKGFNIELTVPEGATAYYSTEIALTAENYQTAGLTALKDLPAAAGTHTVYYYVTNGTVAVSGSKRVIIDKAAQAAPDATKVLARGETWRNSADGCIAGLTPRKMEYRDKHNDGSYATVYQEKIYVVPGTYLVRMMADTNHCASPDLELIVPEGPTITVSFESNAPVADVTGLACGDLVPRPASDPVMPDATFLGWYYGDVLYDFNAVVTHSMTLTAAWKPAVIDFTLPASLTEIKESAFEGASMKSVEIPKGCTIIGPYAFKDCTALKQIRIPASVEFIVSTAFDGCSDVQIFGVPGSKAELLCTPETGFTFVTDLG